MFEKQKITWGLKGHLSGDYQLFGNIICKAVSESGNCIMFAFHEFPQKAIFPMQTFMKYIIHILSFWYNLFNLFISKYPGNSWELQSPPYFFLHMKHSIHLYIVAYQARPALLKIGTALVPLLFLIARIHVPLDHDVRHTSPCTLHTIRSVYPPHGQWLPSRTVFYQWLPTMIDHDWHWI